MNEEVQNGSQECLLRASAPVFPKCEPVDRLFAVVYLLVGYGFVLLCSDVVNRPFTTAYTIFYAAVVLVYLWGKEIRPPKESWFWLAVMLAAAIPYPYWSVLPVLQFFALLVVAAYWTLCASGRLLKGGQTSQWVFFDGWNALAVVPFCNFGCQIRVLFEGGRQEDASKGKSGRFGGVFLGVLIAIPVLVVILPLLSSADDGFQRLLGSLGGYIGDHLLANLVRMLFAVPVSLYLFGLVFGGVHGRNTDRFQEETLEEMRTYIRVVPDTAVCTVLAVVCLVYSLFMGIQGNYLFSAFAGTLPGTFTYSEYARRGFFELCQIGVWNLLLSGAAGACSRTDRRKHRGLGLLIALLSVLTLFLLGTAVSKMGMYISVYGLTVYRILPLLFMLWMGLVFVCILLRRTREFPAVRLCVLAGAAIFCLVCVCPLEYWT